MLSAWSFVCRCANTLYFQLEDHRLELHTNCELCDEIRNFLNLPNYRADNIQNDNDWQPVFIVARKCLKARKAAKNERSQVTCMWFGCTGVPSLDCSLLASIVFPLLLFVY